MLKNTKTYTVTNSLFLTPKVKQLTLTKTDNGLPAYLPGQFITIHFTRAEKTYRRSYSIASIEGQTLNLDFAASYVDHGPGSEYLFALQSGDSVEVSGPFGRLVLKEEPVKRLFLIATGTGITPYRAMLPALTAKIEATGLRVHIVQGVQYRHDVLYAADFLAWAKANPDYADYRSYLSREDLTLQQAPYEHRGYVQQCFDEFKATASTDVVYLCGNPLMIDASFAALQAKGFASSQIRREKYISSK